MEKKEIINRASQIEGWFDNSHMNVLYELANEHIKENGLSVEVGSWKGRSSYILASICKQRNARLICIDTFEGIIIPNHPKFDLYQSGYYKEAANDKFFILHIKKNLSGLPVEFIKGDSREAHKKISDNSVDLCFVDGDHNPPVVDEDIKNFWSKVKKGGIYCGHDYDNGNEVADAVDNFLGKNKIQVKDTIWSIIK